MLPCLIITQNVQKEFILYKAFLTENPEDRRLDNRREGLLRGFGLRMEGISLGSSSTMNTLSGINKEIKLVNRMLTQYQFSS